MQEISIYLPGIIMAYSAFLLGMASPGPNILAVIGTSMSVGRSSGIAQAFGVAFGSLTWAILTVIGLAALLSTYANALFVIKVFGGLYLLWLAYKPFKSAIAKHDIEVTELAGGKRSAIGYVKRGYIVQMTNPKAALTWIAIISLGLEQDAPLWVALVIIIGTFLLSVIIHTVYAVAFSTPVMVEIYGKARRKIQFTLGMFFGFAGTKLLISEI